MSPINNIETTDAHHPNGRLKVTTKVRPMRNDDVFARNVFPDNPSGQLLDGILQSFPIKQEHRMGWPNVSACGEKLDPYPNELVACHQWGVAFIIMTLSEDPKFKDEFPDFDLARAIKMALIHDLPELKTGDITPRDGISPEEKHKMEAAAMEQILERFPKPIQIALSQLYIAYENRQCTESKVVKDCDKLDFMIQAFLLERQGTDGCSQEGLSDFYVNSIESGFYSKIVKDLANTLLTTRAGLVRENSLYEGGRCY